jgi:hypothetical protein
VGVIQFIQLIKAGVNVEKAKRFGLKLFVPIYSALTTLPGVLRNIPDFICP